MRLSRYCARIYKLESAGASTRPTKKGKNRVDGQREMLLPISGKTVR
jgi:hypothetical protein